MEYLALPDSDSGAPLWETGGQGSLSFVWWVRNISSHLPLCSWGPVEASVPPAVWAGESTRRQVSTDEQVSAQVTQMWSHHLRGGVPASLPLPASSLVVPEPCPGLDRRPLLGEPCRLCTAGRCRRSLLSLSMHDSVHSQLSPLVSCPGRYYT